MLALVVSGMTRILMRRDCRANLRLASFAIEIAKVLD
jgi:hypothetical protein